MRLFQNSLALLVFTGISGFAANIVTDFPITPTNPNGVWTYGYKSTTTGAFTAFTTGQFFDGTLHGFDGGGDLSVYLPEADGTNGGTVIFDDDFVNLHPSSGGLIPVVRWTAPSLDVYTISFLFKAHDTSPSGTGLNVVINNSVNWTDSFSSGDSLETRGDTLILPLAAGSTVDFQIDFQGNYAFDSTGLQGTIAASAVPEPSTIAVMAAGLVTMALFRRKF